MARNAMGAAIMAAGLSPLSGWAQGATIETSPRPLARPDVAQIIQVREAANAEFSRWLDGFRPRALAAGISAGTLDLALRDIRYRADVITSDGNQSEFVRPIWDYLDSAASDTRIRNGRAALERHAAVLDQIEARYGVDKHIVVAVWGLESAYGEHRGTTPILDALATLAFDGRRGAFFEQQLIAALQIVQAGDVAPRAMTGSWAGAMGHTQFMPTSYLEYAVDFTGDGKRDIWSDNPADALASTAAYLARFGWNRGQPWGVEVRLPRGFDYALASRSVTKTPAEWARLGVGNMDGFVVPDHGPASILLPAGANGAVFMVFANFGVIERYNRATSYVIGVGHLADRLRGGPAIQAGWPRGDAPLNSLEREQVQQLLANRGYLNDKIDGIIGPNTINAIRSFQSAVGVTPDGYPSQQLLALLRR
ncbi:MAG: lytic murein transglycosylase [Paracoccaceae bacterium]